MSYVVIYSKDAGKTWQVSMPSKAHTTTDSALAIVRERSLEHPEYAYEMHPIDSHLLHALTTYSDERPLHWVSETRPSKEKLLEWFGYDRD